MWAYLIHSSICLLVLLTFYALLLEKAPLHRFNRFFLLGAILLSIIIPLVTITEIVPPGPQENPLLDTALSQTVSKAVPDRTWEQRLPDLLWIPYLLGTVLFALKFLWNLATMLYTIKSGHKLPFRKFTHVLLPRQVAPHTFFRYIFFDQQRYRSKTIPKEIFWHEEAHALQKHSVDILLMEVLQLLFWFHPLIYITKRFVRLNHEFLADRAVLDKGADTSIYQEILLACVSNAKEPSLANAITFSSIKKRFKIMKTANNKKTSWLRCLLLLPLTAVLFISFSNKQLVHQPASPAQISEYNTLAKKYNGQDPKNLHILKKEVDRMQYLYALMTTEQREAAETFPQLPPAPEAPVPPGIAKDPSGIPSAPPAPTAPKRISAENVHRFIGPIIPPKPNPDPLEYIREMAEKGAIFQIGPHTYKAEEVIELFKKSTNAPTIDVSNFPRVQIGGC
ncbi:MAG: M56 family metallopeptidase [Sediminicola sp.]